MSLDFSNAQLPRLLPLENSYTENEVEADLKRLFLDLFDSTLAADVFDVNVLGAAHLGSFDMVRKAVNADGLVLMQGDREEAATRYLYRAWKSGDVQGRGLHFLRTYLQMLSRTFARSISSGTTRRCRTRPASIPRRRAFPGGCTRSANPA